LAWPLDSRLTVGCPMRWCWLQRRGGWSKAAPTKAVVLVSAYGQSAWGLWSTSKCVVWHDGASQDAMHDLFAPPIGQCCAWAALIWWVTGVALHFRARSWPPSSGKLLQGGVASRQQLPLPSPLPSRTLLCGTSQLQRVFVPFQAQQLRRLLVCLQCGWVTRVGRAALCSAVWLACSTDHVAGPWLQGTP
jgi:hypothetical protein